MKRIATTDFRDHLRDRFIDAQTTASARLAPTHFLTNEMGVDGDIREELSSSGAAKVEFDIPSVKLKGAELLFYVNADRATENKIMRLQVNGHVLTHRQNRERMLTGGWDRKKESEIGIGQVAASAHQKEKKGGETKGDEVGTVVLLIHSSTTVSMRPLSI